MGPIVPCGHMEGANRNKGRKQNYSSYTTWSCLASFSTIKFLNFNQVSYFRFENQWSHSLLRESGHILRRICLETSNYYYPFIIQNIGHITTQLSVFTFEFFSLKSLEDLNGWVLNSLLSSYGLLKLGLFDNSEF